MSCVCVHVSVRVSVSMRVRAIVRVCTHARVCACSKTFRMQDCHRCSVGLYTAEDPSFESCTSVWLLPFNGWYPKLDVVSLV